MAAIPASKPARNQGEPFKPFMNVVQSEWTKLITHRNSHILLLVSAILAVSITALLMWGIGVSWDQMTDADRAAFNPLETSMVGLFFSGILSLVIAAGVVTNEYSSGMIRQTMTVTSDRKLVVLAKMAVVSAYLLIPTLIITFATTQVGQMVFSGYEIPTADVFGSDFRMLFWMGLSGVFYPILTVGVGFLMRSAASTIAIVMLTMFFPAMFGGMLPRSIQENVLAFLPGNAIDAWVMGHLHEEYAQYLDRPLAAVVTIVWVILIAGLAIWNLNRRDVG